MTDEKQIDFSKFGVTAEAVEKSKDIYPTFNIGNLEEGTMVDLTILDDEPKNVEHTNKYPSKERPEKTIKTPVLTVEIDTIHRPQKSGEVLEVDMKGVKNTLWLSSKSLALGLAKVAEEKAGVLSGCSVRIKITTADYKDYGENRCYNVSTL